MKTEEKNKGITLVALIITIIILIILAAVTIYALYNSNFIDVSISSTQKYTEAQIKEREEIDSINNKIQGAIIETDDEDTVTISKLEYEALKSLKTVTYKDMLIIFDEKTHKFKYYYNNKEILPIYWYGFEYVSDGAMTPWYETNNIPKITKNEQSFIYSAYYTNANAYCVGGLTTSRKINLSNYTKCHMIINSSNVLTKMQYVSYTGSLGNNYQANENVNLFLNMPAVSGEPVEYVGDISRANGNYYIGLQSWNASTNMDIAAWWLETGNEVEGTVTISKSEYETLKKEKPGAYENLIMNFDEASHNFKYYYNDKEILPIYWYGIEYNMENAVTPWYETNNVATITKNERSFIYSAYQKTPNYHVGGLTTSRKINLSNYTKCHMIINSSNVLTKMQYVSYTGSLGNNYQANENVNLFLNMPAVSSGPVEYVGDISGANGSYYIGLQSWNASTNMDIVAWWLE